MEPRLVSEVYECPDCLHSYVKEFEKTEPIAINLECPICGNHSYIVEKGDQFE